MDHRVDVDFEYLSNLRFVSWHSVHWLLRLVFAFRILVSFYNDNLSKMQVKLISRQQQSMQFSSRPFLLFFADNVFDADKKFLSYQIISVNRTINPQRLKINKKVSF